MSRLIRKRHPQEHRGEEVGLNESKQRQFSAQLIRYTLPMDHLTELSVDDLQEWKEECDESSCRSYTALDCLYELNP